MFWNTAFSKKNGINFKRTCNRFSVLCILGPPGGHGIIGGLICATDFNIMIVAEVVARDLSCLGSKVGALPICDLPVSM
jgi:hypothetical protein